MGGLGRKVRGGVSGGEGKKRGGGGGGLLVFYLSVVDVFAASGDHKGSARDDTLVHQGLQFPSDLLEAPGGHACREEREVGGWVGGLVGWVGWIRWV